MPCEDSEKVQKERATTHTLLISGIFSGGIPVLSRCRMAFSSSSGVTLEVTVRSSDANVGYKLANSVH
jgi:coatomer protein complex subunit gamma